MLEFKAFQWNEMNKKQQNLFQLTKYEDPKDYSKYEVFYVNGMVKQAVKNISPKNKDIIDFLSVNYLSSKDVSILLDIANDEFSIPEHTTTWKKYKLLKSSKYINTLLSEFMCVRSSLIENTNSAIFKESSTSDYLSVKWLPKKTLLNDINKLIQYFKNSKNVDFKFHKFFPSINGLIPYQGTSFSMINNWLNYFNPTYSVPAFNKIKYASDLKQNKDIWNNVENYINSLFVFQKKLNTINSNIIIFWMEDNKLELLPLNVVGLTTLRDKYDKRYSSRNPKNIVNLHAIKNKTSIDFYKCNCEKLIDVYNNWDNFSIQKYSSIFDKTIDYDSEVIAIDWYYKGI